MNHSLTNGPLKKALLLFAVPLFFSQLFQTLYNTADTVIIGYYLGDASLAAVGSVAALFELIVGFCTGFGQGLGVIAAQKYGAGDSRGFKSSIALSIVLSLVFSILLSVFVFQGMRPILHALKTPADLFDQAYSYISVIAAGLVVTMFYNLCAGMLRAAGDSKTPLYILLISSVLNVALDIVLITHWKMGVAGTAWATLIAQGISLLVCLIWIGWKKRMLVPSWHDFSWNGSLISSLCQMGFSMALMSSIVSCGTLILQTGINPLGTDIISGHTAARKLIAILNLPVSSLMMALSSFVAQNFGAGQLERVEKGIAFSNRLGLYYSIALTILTMVGSRLMVQMISGTANPVVVDTGSLYLLTNIPFFPMLAVLLNLRTSLQSMSMKIVPILSSVIELLGKLLFTWLVVPAFGYAGICATEPAVWTAMALWLAYFYLQAPVFKKSQIRCRLFR